MGDNWPVLLFPSYSCASALLLHKIYSSGINCNPRHRPTGQRSANQRISRKKKPKKKHKIMQNVPPYVFLPRIQPRDLLHFAFSLSFRSFILTSSLSLFLYLRPPSPLPLLQLSSIHLLHSFIPFCYSPPSLSLVWFFFSTPSHRRHPFIMGLLSSRFLRIPRPEVCY